MKSSFVSLNTAVLLSGIGFLTGIARLIVDVRFVPEVFEAMQEDQPGQTGLIIPLFVMLFGGWLWAFVSAARNRRRGLIALLIFNLLIVFIWGLSTLVVLCPFPCWVAPPLTDIVTWANVIVGLVATLAVGLYLRSQPRLADR